MKTKTLYQQLTDKQRQAIEKEAKEFPNTWESILDELNSNYGTTYLKLGNAMTLHGLLYRDPFDLNQYFDIFQN